MLTFSMKLHRGLNNQLNSLVMKYLLLTLFALITLVETNAQATFFKNLDNTSATNIGIGAGIEFNGYHYFTSSFNFSQDALWRTDGTSVNTELVAQYETFSFFVPLTVYNNELYYTAVVDPNVGGVLVKTDGNSPGTVVIDLDTQSAGIANTPAATISSGIILPILDDVGSELYITDGTAAGTSLIKDINPGINSSQPSFLQKLNDKVIFRADDGANGREPWVTDGTEAGTFMLKDINPNGNSFISSFITLGDLVLFNVNGDLWKTDGTEAGTELVMDLLISSEMMYKYDGAVYFSSYDTASDSDALYKTDGSTSGTVILKTGFGDRINDFQKTNNLLFFVGYTDDLGSELWKSDGTQTGTQLVADLFPGAEGAFGSSPELGNGGDRLFFTGYFTDDPELDDDWNDELWSSDGTTAGTGLNTTINDNGFDADISDFFNINGKLLFKADETTNTGINLWQVDATLLSVSTIEAPDFVVAPNPVKDRIELSGIPNRNLSYSIFSSDGRLLESFENTSTSIEVAHLATGIYFIQLISTEGWKETKQFIKN